MAEKYTATEDLVLNKNKGKGTMPPKKGMMNIPKENVHASVVIQLERPKDTNNPKRQSLAEEVKKNTEAMLQETFKGDKLADYQLKVYVVLASEGSSLGRFWAAELGMGWVKLCLAWILTKKNEDGKSIEGMDEKKKDDETVGYGRFKATDSGACGFADLCDSNYGEDVLTCKLTDQLVNKIITTVSGRQ